VKKSGKNGMKSIMANGEKRGGIKVRAMAYGLIAQRRHGVNRKAYAGEILASSMKS